METRTEHKLKTPASRGFRIWREKMPDTRTMYIEFREPANPEAVRKTLEEAGIDTHDIREVTENHDGYILT